MRQIYNKRNTNEAARRLSGFAASHMNFSEVSAYNRNYQSVIDHQSHSISSSSINLESNEQFKQWLPWLIEHKDKAVPKLVHYMLNEDIYALSIYKCLKVEIGGVPPLSLREIRANPELKALYPETMSAQAEAFINAIHWLSSEEAAHIFEHNDADTQELCTINNLLGISNNHINCTD